MRTRDIRVGGTYIVNVPQRIPPAVRDRVPRGREEFAADMRLHLHRGRRFEITVTDVHVDARTVDGFESVTTSKVALPLTVEQAEALGLPETGQPYMIEGLVLDAERMPVKLPTTLAYTGLPTRWLDPLGTPTMLSDLSVAYYRYRVRQQAAGMEAALVAQEAAEMLEKQREVAGRALDDYDAEEHLRTVEVQCAEWQRIELVMRVTGAECYRPQDDPDLTEDDLKNPIAPQD
ncbi:hypothetical protein ACMATS_38105 (plasmid) [Streptoverticillium reticulum]|uniref:hypothetical protein n=1 Tax=Streptoverticillium reticulum TaxID=1433415 RepID=UPI0039BFC144